MSHVEIIIEVLEKRMKLKIMKFIDTVCNRGRGRGGRFTTKLYRLLPLSLNIRLAKFLNF